MAFPGTKHGKRRRPYRVKWEKGTETVNASEWRRALADGWIVPVRRDDGQLSDRVAQLACNVVATLRDGILYLKDLKRRAEVFIYTSWRAIDAKAPMIRGEFYFKEIRRQYANERPNPDADVIDRYGQFEGPGGVPVRIYAS